MTPGGHVGASVVATYVITNYVFKTEATPVVLALGAVAGMLPDIDVLAGMALKRERPRHQKVQHHRYVTHTPFFYLVLTVLLAMFVPAGTALLFGVLVFTHLALDSWATDDGIMWLWPLSNRQYALFPRDLHAGDVFGREFYRRVLRCKPMIVPEFAFSFLGVVLAAHAMAGVA
jgi:hypothetical protein